MRTTRRAFARSGSVLAVSLLALMAFVAPARATSGPDLVATKTSDAEGTQSIGARFSFTIAVTNRGDADAKKVVLADDLPIGMKVTGPPVQSFGDGSCFVASSVSTDRPEAWSVYCKADIVSPEETASATFEVVITSDVRCGEVVNEARAEAANAGKDTASATVEVACPPSLSLTKTAPAYGHVGDQIPFTMRVSNRGMVSFQDVQVADPGCATPPKRISDGNGDEALGPHEVWVYRCTAEITEETPRLFTTTATVAGPTGGVAGHGADPSP